MRHLSECPEDFLGEPVGCPNGIVHTAAVVFDVLTMLGGTPTALDVERFEGDAEARNELRTTLVVCWLLSHPWFRERGVSQHALKLLQELPRELAALVTADTLIRDPDRREELSRLVIRGCDAIPVGETEAHAADRLKSISSLERKRLLEVTREQVERAKKLREALEAERAREAASRYTGE
ncbi:MAG: hypothetical protein R3E66_13970 [bacterium]